MGWAALPDNDARFREDYIREKEAEFKKFPD
jgi:hypothetical protein